MKIDPYNHKRKYENWIYGLKHLMEILKKEKKDLPDHIKDYWSQKELD